VAVDAKGDVFISSQYQIREVTPDGIIHTFAGTGTKGVIGDGGRATEAELTGPSGLAVGPDGSLYIADYTAEVVRKVDAHGIISTVAGNGRDGSSGDGGKATEAELDHPANIALTPSGELLIATRTSIRDVGLNGIISTYVG
jgi:serine/threonine-protein kinase